jgi:hypothetical protein
MVTEKRSQERVKSEGYVYYSDAIPENYIDKYEGQIVDISPDGICINTEYEMKIGSQVSFYSEGIYNGIYTGTVKRCTKSSNDKYNIGLEVPFMKTKGSDTPIH